MNVAGKDEPITKYLRYSENITFSLYLFYRNIINTTICKNINPLNLVGSVTLDTKALGYTTLGAVLVITGVVLKNTFEQLKMPDHPWGKTVGMASFVIGWAIVAYAVATAQNGGNNNRTMLSFGTAAAIVFSVVQMKSYMVKGESPPMMYPVIFAGSWLLLGYTVGLGRGGNQSYLGLAAAVMVLLSMMWSLPWQRKVGVIDGPGMPLFTGAWALLAFANSLY